ncbi:MBL fold metallo-hydrolase [Caulobacter sp. KR2-114]|uniref:MBL fold metallo-hydrolase n=1 Tax=Caulobacter sp. KR2-114 TaxID=3400912 RepID=UPI003C0FDAEA
MKVRFWGTRGSLPVAQRADAALAKIARALVAADGRRFASEAAAAAFARRELDFATYGSFGGATSCVEIEASEEAFVVCDMGSGLREFGLSALRRCAEGHPRVYHFFLSHMHWDHIMGFPYFRPAFETGATIVIHAGHADAEAALRRQQEEISFPVSFDELKARIQFVVHRPEEAFEAAGLEVSLVPQSHAHGSFGWRFDRPGKAVVYSTDAEHAPERMDDEVDFQDFFAGADLVIKDTMYSLGDTASLKLDLGHSSNLVGVDLCHAAGVKRLALFHHEPAYSDDDIQRMYDDTRRYEESVRGERPPLEVVCAYDGLEIEI